jgi:hypothetical protein
LESLRQFFKRILPGPKLIDTFRNKITFYGEGLLAPRLRTTPCLLSSAAYAIYSQLASTVEGRLSNRNPRRRYAVVTRGPTSHDSGTHTHTHTHTQTNKQTNSVPFSPQAEYTD